MIAFHCNSLLRRLIVLMMVWGIGCGYLMSQNISVQTKIDRTEIKTGEQAVVEFTIRTNNIKATEIFFPADSIGERFEILTSEVLDTIRVDGNIHEMKGRYLLTSFDSTLVTIPPMMVQTPTEKAYAQSMVLNVIQPKVDVSKPDVFFDIKKPWQLPYTIWDILVLVYTHPISWVLMLLMLIGIIWRETRYRKYLKRKERITQPSIILTPLEEAEQALSHLQQTRLLEHGLHKQYYTDLVEILKTYMLRKKNLAVMEMTTSEVVNLLQNQNEYGELIDNIKQIFSVADMVKFARYKPSEEVPIQSICQAHLFLAMAEKHWSVTSVNSDTEELSNTKGGIQNL